MSESAISIKLGWILNQSKVGGPEALLLIIVLDQSLYLEKELSTYAAHIDFLAASSGSPWPP